MQRLWVQPPGWRKNSYPSVTETQRSAQGIGQAGFFWVWRREDVPLPVQAPQITHHHESQQPILRSPPHSASTVAWLFLCPPRVRSLSYSRKVTTRKVRVIAPPREPSQSDTCKAPLAVQADMSTALSSGTYTFYPLHHPSVLTNTIPSDRTESLHLAPQAGHTL